MYIANKKDFISAIVLLLAMSGFYVDSMRIDLMGGTGLGPLFFPYLMMGIISLLALVLLASSLSFHTSSRPAENVPKAEKEWTKDQCIFIGMFTVYLLLLPLAGYIGSTLCYLFANMIYLGKKENKWYAIYALTTICVTAFIYYIFSTVMLLFLP